MRNGGSTHSTRRKPRSEQIRPRWPARTPTPVSRFETPEPPDGLGATGLDVWERLWELGGAAGVYDLAADWQTILRYASLSDRRWELMERLNADGWIVDGSRGQQAVAPAARLLRDTETQMRQLEDSLGLNPKARIHLTGLALGNEETKSELEAYLAG